MPIEDYSSKSYIRRARQNRETYYEEPEPDRPERPGRPNSRARVEARRTQRLQRRSPLRSLFWLLCFVAIVLFGLPYGIDIAYANRVLPNIRVQGQDVAGLDQDELRTLLAERYGEFLDQPIQLVFEDQRWQPTFQQLGVRFDLDSAVADVLSAGRSGNPLKRLQDQWQIWRVGLDVAPRIVADRGAMLRYLQSLSAAIEEPPSDAALSVAEGKVIGTPSKKGLQMLADETSYDILQALQYLQPSEVAIRTRELEPSINDTALIKAQQTASELLSSPVVLLQGERSWIWDQKTISELIDLTPVDQELQVTISPERLGKMVDKLAIQVDTGSAEPRVRFNGGALTIIQEGTTGWSLRKEDAVQAISDTLRLSHGITRTLALPVDELKPQVRADTLDSLGIVELIGEGKSSFAGSAQYRITNIKAGAARMDGVLIPPDSEFSFNTQLGEVTEANGFVEGYAIIGNRTQLEWGGGVCQDSTTVFRAAFWAGLPITERHAHSFYISWYDRYGLGELGDGAGLDAAIFTGVNDLKFLNNTGHWILMQATVDEVNQVLTVRLYGTKDRSVEVSQPVISNEIPAPTQAVYLDDPTRPAGTIYQSDTARGGRDILIYRTVTVNGVKGEPEPFFTRFQPWPNVFVRGTGG
jgi:Uncharacterized vancomycin resistance protein